MSDKPIRKWKKRASNYGTIVSRQALTSWYTQPHTTPASRQPKAASIQRGEAGDDFSYTLCICLYFCSACLYILTYMHKFNLKMTVSTCVRNIEKTASQYHYYERYWREAIFVQKCTEREVIRVKLMHMFCPAWMEYFGPVWISLAESH